jgi:hypothetical protein
MGHAGVLILTLELRVKDVLNILQNTEIDSGHVRLSFFEKFNNIVQKKNSSVKYKTDYFGCTTAAVVVFRIASKFIPLGIEESVLIGFFNAANVF